MELSNCWKSLNHAEFSVIIARKTMLGVLTHEKKKHLTFIGTCKLFLFLIPTSCRNVACYLKLINYLDN